MINKITAAKIIVENETVMAIRLDYKNFNNQDSVMEHVNLAAELFPNLPVIVIYFDDNGIPYTKGPKKLANAALTAVQGFGVQWIDYRIDIHVHKL